MLNKVKYIYNNYKEIINYLIFGILTTLVSIITYAIFTRLFNINYNISNVLSWLLAVSFAYITNKNYVFNSKDKNIIKSIIKFFTSRITTLIIEIIFMLIMVDILKFNDMVCKIIVQFIVIVLNYVFSKLFVFNKEPVV